MANTPLIVGSAALSNGKVAVLLGDTDTTTISSNTYTTFDHLQVAILSPGGSAGLNDANALSFPSGGSPNGVFGDPTGGGAIAAMPGGGMAIETWGSSNNDYYVQILSNSGGVTVAPFVVGSANGPDGPFNTIGNIGAWTGGLVAAWNSSDETVTQFQRLTNTGATSGSTITLAPGTGAQDPDGTPPYTWEGSMAVDSQGDVIFSFAAGDVYTSTKYLEYNSANQLVGSGTLGEKEGFVAFVATPGGGFVTAYYTPTGAWNESLGRYPGFNLTIQTISSSGAVTTVKTVANAVGAGQQPSTNNLAVSSNGTFVFQESGQTAYDSYDLSTNTLTRNAFTLGDPLSTVPSANGSGQVYGAAVSGSDVEAETLLVCFAAGTRILTERGDVPVEQLTTADMAMTLSDGARAVRWIGQRRIDLTAHPRPETAAPIRIQRGAFADGVPHSDLLVSPDHAIFVDGMLIWPAS
jgi:Hint domain